MHTPGRNTCAPKAQCACAKGAWRAHRVQRARMQGAMRITRVAHALGVLRPCPGAQRMLRAFCVLRSACKVCYNSPKDLLQPPTIESPISENFERTVTFSKSIKRPLSRNKKMRREKNLEVGRLKSQRRRKIQRSRESEK